MADDDTDVIEQDANEGYTPPAPVLDDDAPEATPAPQEAAPQRSEAWDANWDGPPAQDEASQEEDTRGPLRRWLDSPAFGGSEEKADAAPAKSKAWDANWDGPPKGDESKPAKAQAWDAGWDGPVKDTAAPPSEDEKMGALEAGLHGAGHSVIPGAVGTIASVAAAPSGPLGMIGAGLGAAYLAGKVQNAIESYLWPEEAKRMEKAQEEHPFATGVGEVAGFGPSMGIKGATTLIRGANAAIGGAVDLVLGGDPMHAAGVAAGSAALGAPRGWVENAGERLSTLLARNKGAMEAGNVGGAPTNTQVDAAVKAQDTAGSVDAVGDEAAVRNQSQGGPLNSGSAEEPKVPTAAESVTKEGNDPVRPNPGPQDYGKEAPPVGEGASLKAQELGARDPAVDAALNPKEEPAPAAPREAAANRAPDETVKSEPVGQQPPQDQGIPFVMTNAMKQGLAGRGHTPEEIRNMTPQQAHEILSSKPSAERTEPMDYRQDLVDRGHDPEAVKQMTPEQVAREWVKGPVKQQQQQFQQGGGGPGFNPEGGVAPGRKPSSLLREGAPPGADPIKEATIAALGERAKLAGRQSMQGMGEGGGKLPSGDLSPQRFKAPSEPSVPEVKVTPSDKTGVKGILRDIQKIFAPQTLKGQGEHVNLARETANTINKFHGQLEHLHQQGMRSLDPHQELLHSMDGDRRRMLIDRAMGGDHFKDFVPTQQEERMLGDYKKFYDSWKPILSRIDPDLKFRENYMPGMYENEEAAKDFFSKWKPGGDRGMTYEKTFPTYEDARNAGLKPLTNDPYELAARYGMRVRDFATAEMFKKASINDGLMRYWDKPPPGWERIKDTGNRETTLYAPENLAAVYNNFVDQGLRAQHPRLYDAVQHTLNGYTMVELGVNGYHFTTMAHEGIAHDMARFTNLLAEGKLPEALSTLAKAPFALYLTPRLGNQVIKDYLNPAYKSTVKDLMVDADVHLIGRGHSPESMASARDSFIKLTSAEPIKSQLQNSWRSVKEEFGGALDDKDIGKAAKTAMSNVGRMIQTISHPLFDLYIPRMKAGALHKSIADFLSTDVGKRLDLTNKNGPDWKFAVEQVRKMQNSIDNRFGEAVMNHMFMNKATQQSGQLAMRAFGWAVNSIKEIGGGSYSAGQGLVRTAMGKEGGIGQRMQMSSEHFDPRISYIPGFLMALGLASTVTQYAMTGEMPSSLKDLAFPRTGGKVPGYGTKGTTDERLLMPGYLKDVLGWTGHPFVEMYNKLNGLVTSSYETLSGQDSLGREFVNPRGSALDKVMDRLKYFGERTTPISVQNMMKGPIQGSHIPQWMVGLGFRSPNQGIQDSERAKKGTDARLGRSFEQREKSIQRQEQAHGRQYTPRKAVAPSTLVRQP